MPTHRSTPVLSLALAALVALAGTAAEASAQSACEYQRCQEQTRHPIGQPGTPNMEVMGHVPLPGREHSHADIEVEQELSRPFAYIAQRLNDGGFYAIGFEDPTAPEILYRWTISDPDLHTGNGGMDLKYFKLDDRYYLVLAMQYQQGGPDADLGAVVFDVTGLPDPSTVEKVAEIRNPDLPGGMHNIFAYKHSDGRALLFATTESAEIFVYDLAQVVGGESPGPVARIPVPEPSPTRTGQWHDMYVGYHPASGQDRFYGAGTGGYHVFDVTDLQDPELLTSVTDIPGMQNGHTFTPTPDGNFALGMSAPTYQHAPIRFFDLRPGLSGEVERVTGSGIGAWIVDWKGASHNHEVRWPYAFISAQDDGLQVINMMDPTDPYTQAHYVTREGPSLYGGDAEYLSYLARYSTDGFIYNGVWGVDIRNADGLIVVSDANSGFWAFRMEGFQGWNGNAWNVPNVSSAQDWDAGPVEQAARMPYPSSRTNR